MVQSFQDTFQQDLFVQGTKLVRSNPQCDFGPIILVFTQFFQIVYQSLSNCYERSKIIHISQSICSDRKLALTNTYQVACYAINLIWVCLKLFFMCYWYTDCLYISYIVSCGQSTKSSTITYLVLCALTPPSLCHY